MIKCPACGAENPEGTKICVKCGTELPKAGKEKKKTVAVESAPSRSFHLGDIARDLVDVLFILLIIGLIGFYFMEESCHWAWPPRFTETEEAKIVLNPVLGQPAPSPFPPAIMAVWPIMPLPRRPNRLKRIPKSNSGTPKPFITRARPNMT